jgi:hypothetical protein
MPLHFFFLYFHRSERTRLKQLVIGKKSLQSISSSPVNININEDSLMQPKEGDNTLMLASGEQQSKESEVEKDVQLANMCDVVLFWYFMMVGMYLVSIARVR